MRTEPATVKDSKRFGKRISTMVSTFICISMISLPAFSQDHTFDDNTPLKEVLTQLYECGALFSIQTGCFKNQNTDEGRKATIIATDNENVAVHLIYIYGTRLGLNADQIYSPILPSVSDLMKTMNNRCDNISIPTVHIGPTCDRLIRNPPGQPYDKTQKSG